MILGRDILYLHKKYITDAGGVLVKGDNDKEDEMTVEISPLVSYGGEGLECLKGVKIVTPCVIKGVEDLKKLIDAGK